VVLAPSWLVSLENGLGHKQKHVLYGAALPPPAAFLHFTCVHQSENARTWPMRLFGHWHAKPTWPRPPPTPRAAAALLSVEAEALGVRVRVRVRVRVGVRVGVGVRVRLRVSASIRVRVS